MIRTKELKVYVEDTEEFKEKIKYELGQIDSGKAKKLKENSISFQSLDQLRKFLTPKRIELLRVIRHREPDSIYELAKFVKRTPENVNTDIKLLESLGFVQTEKVEDTRVRVIPKVSYDKLSLEIGI